MGEEDLMNMLGGLTNKPSYIKAELSEEDMCVLNELTSASVLYIEKYICQKLKSLHVVEDSNMLIVSQALIQLRELSSTYQ
jgi:hypothetical protein